jgi:hypothetical protein
MLELEHDPVGLGEQVLHGVAVAELGGPAGEAHARLAGRGAHLIAAEHTRRRASAASVSSVSGRTMTNSSPPHRKHWSSAREAAEMAVATWRRQSSPPAWPKRSFTSLKLSRSPTSRLKG